jgi:hypothetical protein
VTALVASVGFTNGLLILAILVALVGAALLAFLASLL